MKIQKILLYSAAAYVAWQFIKPKPVQSASGVLPTFNQFNGGIPFFDSGNRMYNTDAASINSPTFLDTLATIDAIPFDQSSEYKAVNPDRIDLGTWENLSQYGNVDPKTGQPNYTQYLFF